MAFDFVGHARPLDVVEGFHVRGMSMIILTGECGVYLEAYICRFTIDAHFIHKNFTYSGQEL